MQNLCLKIEHSPPVFCCCHDEGPGRFCSAPADRSSKALNDGTRETQTGQEGKGRDPNCFLVIESTGFQQAVFKSKSVGRRTGFLKRQIYGWEGRKRHSVSCTRSGKRGMRGFAISTLVRPWRIQALAGGDKPRPYIKKQVEGRNKQNSEPQNIESSSGGQVSNIEGM